MSTAIELPKGDSLELDFALQDPEGAALDFDAATLTVKTSPVYTLVGTKTGPGAARFSIPAGSLAVPGGYASAISATTGTTEQGTISFTLKVTDHA